MRSRFVGARRGVGRLFGRSRVRVAFSVARGRGVVGRDRARCGRGRRGFVVVRVRYVVGVVRVVFSSGVGVGLFVAFVGSFGSFY